jgi:hypothetical protein
MNQKSELVVLVGKTAHHSSIYVQTTKTYGAIPVIHDDMDIYHNYTYKYQHHVFSSVTIYYASCLSLMLKDEPEVVIETARNLYNEYKKLHGNIEFHTVNLNINEDFVAENHSLAANKSSIKCILEEIINEKLITDFKKGLRISSKEYNYRGSRNSTESADFSFDSI